ncbi:MAG TPA: FtsW/RodA/SpoVE family cell cycle protein [Bacteroidales bacterium]|nr:FtsW/RodA/SpoVE family cell cycle protein [Bacteroidales bacterium]
MIGTLRKYLKGDPVIWMVIFILSIISILVVYSSTGTLAYRFQGGNTAYYILKHGVILLLGWAVIYVTHLIPYKFYAPLAQLFLFLSVPLLLITLFLGTRLNEASRWLTLPVIGLTIQTSDLAKLALIMFVARNLAIKQEAINDFKNTFLSTIAPVLIICALIAPANLSTAVLLFATCVILMFIGRMPVSYILLLGVTAVAVLSLFVAVSLWTNSQGRVRTWIHRIESFRGSDDEDSYQVEQAKIALVTGGIIGKGPGNSTQRNFLPHPYSDFIYAIIVEEYGIMGGIFVVLLYLVLFFRAGVLVRKSNRTFPAFLSAGLAVLLVFQAFINMAVAVNLLPVTGQPLPLVSMGGSSLLFTCVSLGIILSVSHGLDEEKKKETTVKEGVQTDVS